MLNESTRQRLIDNWLRTQQDVRQALRNAGRAPESIRIIGVSKYVTSDVAQALLEAGCIDLGESRPQQLIEKASHIDRQSVTWHLIGHLQRNKAKRMVELADWIHSVDSLKLLENIAGYASQVGRAPRLLIEVNVSGDQDKHGFRVDELLEAWPAIMSVKGVKIDGLMAMAGIEANDTQTREQFAAVRELRDELCHRFGSSLPELSMGMSGDFEAAIQEGATMIRVGSRLFEGVVS